MENQSTTENKTPETRGLKRLNWMMGSALLGIVAATAFVYLTFAALIANTTDTMSNQATGAASVHTITFNLSSGNTFAAGEQIAVDFPQVSGFVEGGTWAIADFTFSDGVARTIASVDSGPGLTAVACLSGPNNVGVAIDTTALTFRVMPCSSTFAPSAMGAFVTFTINGTLPGGVLFNPTAQGSQTLRILNAAGDCVAGVQSCDTAVVIVDSPSVSVTATVPSLCGNGVLNPNETCDDGNLVNGDGCSAYCTTEGGGGGGGGGTVMGPDTTPPTISNVKVTAITETCATFTWDTNEATNSRVSYGATSTYGTPNADFGYVAAHSKEICDFAIGASYHFQVCSTDSASNQACSADFTFTTRDETPPVLSDAVASGISCSGATIIWTTDENTSQFVDYGFSAAQYTSVAGAATPSQKNHSVALTGLEKKKVYHYRARSSDAAENEAFTSDVSFSTSASCDGADTTPPVITNVKAVAITGTTATITWDTDENADSHGDYGKSETYGGSAASATLVKSHSLNLTGLTPSTVYHYKVTSEDAARNAALSADFIFTTTNAPACKADCAKATFVPYIINPDASERRVGTNFVLVNHLSAGVDRYSFEDKGVDVDYNDVVVDVNSASCGTVTFTMTIAPNATWHHQVRAEIFYANGLKKDVSLWADSYGGPGHPMTVSYENDQQVCAGSPPVISNVVVSDATVSGARITWETDRPTNSMINYGATTAYGYTASATSLTTNHLLIVSGLAPGTSYHFRARASDSAGAVVIGNDGTFTTAADTTPPANVTTLSATPSDSTIGLTWTNPTDPDFVRVVIRRKATGYPTGPTDGKLVYTGTDVKVNDLTVTNGVTYYYAAYAYDAVGNSSSGAVASATPVGPPDKKTPGLVTNLRAKPGDAHILLEWTNPTDPDFAGVKLVRKIGSAPNGWADGTVVYDGPGSAIDDAKLTNGVTYYYAAYAYDAVPNVSAGVGVSGTPAAVVVKPTVPAVTVPPVVGVQPFVLSCVDSDGGQKYEVKGQVTITKEKGADTFEDNCSDAQTLHENYCENGVRYAKSYDCGAGNTCIAGACVHENFILTTEKCGNGLCAENENSVSCPSDCPVGVVVPPLVPKLVTVEKNAQLHAADLQFFATTANIPLRMFGGRLQVYERMSFTVSVAESLVKKTIKVAQINFAESAFALQKNAGNFQATVATPGDAKEHLLTVLLDYTDGTHDEIAVPVVSMRRGVVTETVAGVTKNSAGARVTLLVDTGAGNFGLWNGAASGQQNPQVTDNEGSFGFILPQGTYKLIAEKNGFLSKETLRFPFDSENVVTTSLQLMDLPPVIDPANPETILENTKFGVLLVGNQLKEIGSNAFVQKWVKNFGVPGSAAAALANVAAMGAGAVPSLLYVYSFLARPTLLFGGRRRKKWGIVYNSLTKLPVDLAIVRLLDARTGRVIRSAVTDKDGRYFFSVKPGEYKLLVVKSEHVFPSVILHEQKEDALFVDLYHGESIVAQERTEIAAHIPIDPVTATVIPRKFFLEALGRRLHASLGVFSVLGMAIAAIVSPSPVVFGLLGVTVIMFAVSHRVGVAPKLKDCGIVHDDHTKKPVAYVIVRLFEAKSNRLIETRLTDSHGQYAFLVGKNEYYVTFEKRGYQNQQVDHVDLIPYQEKKKDGAQVAAVDVSMVKVRKLAVTPGHPLSFGT